MNGKLYAITNHSPYYVTDKLIEWTIYTITCLSTYFTNQNLHFNCRFILTLPNLDTDAFLLISYRMVVGDIRMCDEITTRFQF